MFPVLGFARRYVAVFRLSPAHSQLCFWRCAGGNDRRRPGRRRRKGWREGAVVGIFSEEDARADDGREALALLARLLVEVGKSRNDCAVIVKPASRANWQ